MVSEAYGFPLKPFLSVLCYLWPSPHGARTRDGAPADRSDFDHFENFEHFEINAFRKWSSRSRILWVAGGRGGSRGGGGEGAARFRNQEVQKRHFPKL